MTLTLNFDTKIRSAHKFVYLQTHSFTTNAFIVNISAQGRLNKKSELLDYGKEWIGRANWQQTETVVKNHSAFLVLSDSYTIRASAGKAKAGMVHPLADKRWVFR